MSTQPAQGALPGMPAPLYAASPSKLLAFLDCPRRYRLQYLDRPAPEKRRQRAHTSLGNAVHNALRDWWDLPDPHARRPGPGWSTGPWIDVGFRDGEQSREWRVRMRGAVTAYLGRRRPGHASRSASSAPCRSSAVTCGSPVGSTGSTSATASSSSSTTRPRGWRPPTTTPAPRWRSALYAAAVWKMFRRRTLRVELHHVPTGTVAVHEHSPESLTRKVEQARSIARDARRADADFAELGEASALFPPRPGPLCGWCDLRAHCPEGQAAGPEKSDWAALEEPVPAGWRGSRATTPDRHPLTCHTEHPTTSPGSQLSRPMREPSARHRNSSASEGEGSGIGRESVGPGAGAPVVSGASGRLGAWTSVCRS